MKTLLPFFQNRIHDSVKVGTSIEIFAAVARVFIIVSVEFPRFVHVVENHKQLFNAVVAVFQNARPFFPAQVLPIVPSDFYRLQFISITIEKSFVADVESFHYLFSGMLETVF
jgi:hypothetical protein